MCACRRLHVELLGLFGACRFACTSAADRHACVHARDRLAPSSNSPPRICAVEGLGVPGHRGRRLPVHAAGADGPRLHHAGYASQDEEGFQAPAIPSALHACTSAPAPHPTRSPTHPCRPPAGMLAVMAAFEVRGRAGVWIWRQRAGCRACPGSPPSSLLPAHPEPDLPSLCTPVPMQLTHTCRSCR